MDKEYQRRQVLPLLVMAQQPFQLTRPKLRPSDDAPLPWLGGWPQSVPAEVLFDPLSTVSATYGVAFQSQFRANANVWSSKPAVFVIDQRGVLRHVATSPNQDIREKAIFPIVDDLLRSKIDR
jgi:hypothetical protein